MIVNNVITVIIVIDFAAVDFIADNIISVGGMVIALAININNIVAVMIVYIHIDTSIEEKTVLDYVERAFHMSLEAFKKSALDIFQTRIYYVNGKRYLNLEDIAQWEQIVIDESTYTSTKQFLDFCIEHCNDNEYSRALIQDLNKMLDEEFINGLKNIARS